MRKRMSLQNTLTDKFSCLIESEDYDRQVDELIAMNRGKHVSVRAKSSDKCEEDCES